MDPALISESDLGVSPPRLLITPDEPGLTNTVLALESGLAGCIFGVTIMNKSSVTLWIVGFELELP
jgi:hypothetical protein